MRFFDFFLKKTVFLKKSPPRCRKFDRGLFLRKYLKNIL